jgi:hypothetical protein
MKVVRRSNCCSLKKTLTATNTPVLKTRNSVVDTDVSDIHAASLFNCNLVINLPFLYMEACSTKLSVST